MRRIETEEIRTARSKRRMRIFAVLMLFLLLGSTAGYAFISSISGGTTPVPGETGQQIGSRYVQLINGQQHSFTVNPTIALQTPVSISNTIGDYAGVSLYIDSENEGIYTELASIFGLYASRVSPACYGQCERDLVEKDCTVPLIVWRASDTPQVYQQGLCIFVEGDMRAADALLYTLLGVKQPNG